MKKTVKLLCGILAGTLAMASLGGCGPKLAPDTAEVIELSYWTSGLGEDIIKETIAGFEAKYPEYKVYYDPNASGSAILNTFGYGPNYDTVDLYMYAINGLAEEDIIEYAEPLDDLVNSRYEDEALTLGEKIMPKFRDALKSSDGKYHALTYGGGWTGIAYNQNVIDGEKFEVPNTTDELIELAGDLDDANLKPFIHYQTGGYWMTVVNVWQLQYDGLDYYMNTFLPLDDGTTAPSLNVLMAEDGRKKAMDVMEKIITPGYVYNGSNALVFTDAQTLFLNDAAVMMVNGSWMINEMKQHLSEEQNFSMMATPVISSIVDKCDTIRGEAGKSADEELSALIDAIDAADSMEDVSLQGTGYDVRQEDMERIYEARNTMHSNFDQHGILIPTYSTAKEAAKLFVQYFYSDENIRKYREVSHMPIPVQYSDGSAVDMDGWLDWEIQQARFTERCTTVFEESNKASKIFTAGGCTPYANIDFVTAFCNTNPQARLSSDAVWSQMLQTFERDWDTYVSNAQL